MPAQAATPVLVDVTTNTTWRLADSPYLVSSDIGVTNNAVLTIEPGVHVRFESQASLRVERGTLSARGTSIAPIVFTSIEDDGSGTPAPGDWGVLGFERDTHDGSTVLSHVQVRYGQGIVVEGAAPTFDNLQIAHSAGPAITLDLHSSPHGQGLQASGNQLNGVLVPAGEIDTNVVWALRGIPYVLEQGTIYVGRPTFGLSPSQLQLTTGVLGMLEVTIPNAAPAGGLAVDVVSSVPSVAGVPAVVVVAEGERSAQIEVHAHAPGTSAVSASAAGFGTVIAAVRVVEPPALSLTPSQSVISMESGGQIAVSISDLAPAGGREVSLVVTPQGVIDVPDVVVVPPGAMSVDIDITGMTLGTAALAATADGYVSAFATVTVRPVSLNPPATLLVAPGLTRSMPILLTDPAPAGGLTISLESDDPAITTTQASVHVPAGASSVNVDVNGVAVGNAQITAHAPDYESGITQVHVESVTIQLQPAGVISVPQGMKHIRSVHLSRPAPAGGVWVSVESLDSSVASVSPSSVFIPAAQTMATSTLILKGEAVGSTPMSLNSPGFPEMEVVVNVGQPVRLEFSRSAIVAGKGLNTYEYDVYLRRMTGSGGYSPATSLSVNIVSADPGKVSAQATVTIPAGQYQTTFRVTGHALTDEPVAINAAADGHISSQSALMVSVVKPQLDFTSLDGTRGVGGANDDFYLRWYVPGAPSAWYQTASDDQVITVSIDSAEPEGLVSAILDWNGDVATQITILKDQNRSHYSNGWRAHYVASPTAAGTYRLMGALAGVGEWTSNVQEVVGASLEFSRSSMIVGHDLNSYEYDLYVRLRANGQYAPTAAALAVEMVSEDPDKVSAPATVTIPAGQYQATFRVTGNALTDEPVAINAVAVGYTSSQAPLMVSVVTPQLDFTSLDGTRGVGGANDDFYLRWYVPGAPTAWHQTASVDQVITVSIDSAQPAGLVSAILDWNGDVASQITILQDQNRSHYFNGWRSHYVASPTAAGTYQLKGALADVGEWTSNEQMVVAASLDFSRSATIVGHGLNSYEYDVYVRLRANGQYAPTAAALAVEMVSDDPGKVSAPATVTIPAGQYQATFRVTGHELTDEPVAINAQATGYTSTQVPLMVSVVTPQLDFAGIDGTRGVGGINDDFYLRWYVPGAPNPWHQTASADQVITVSIDSAEPEGLVSAILDWNGDIASQITILQDQNRSHYSNGWRSHYVASPTAAGTYQLKGVLAGVGDWASSVQAVGLPELRFNRSAVVVGKTMNSYAYEIYLRRTVNGAAFYGAEALAVSLSCSASEVCSVPTVVSIPARQYETNFVITGTGLGATKVVPTATGYLAAQDLDVTTITPELVFSAVPASLTTGASASFSVSLRTPGAYYEVNQTAAVPIPIDLTSSQPSVATVPSQVIVNTGARTVSSTLTATGAGSTTLTASGVDLVPVTSATITVQQP